MELIGKIVGVSILGATIAILLKKTNPEYALMASLATCLVVFYLCVDSLNYVISGVNYIISKSNADREIVGMIFKICGIGIVSEYFCNIIEDTGETAIAKKAQMATKIIIFAMTIPLVMRVVDNIWGLF